jgi:uncharacterized protein (TIGR03118 family)
LLSAYEQVNLIGYRPGMAQFTDPNLNGWGMDFAPNGSFCVANTFSTGVATFYTASGQVLPLSITVPAAPGQPFGPVGHPTGVVYNPTTDFVISANGKSAPARFLFDTFDGLICGWNPAVDPTHAIVMVDNSAEAPHHAVYTGLTIAQNSRGQNVLYAADWGFGASNSNNRIDMFDGRFHSLGSFTDPSVATQYPSETAFQVENVHGLLFVTFGSLGTTFGGVVDVFDSDGQLLTPNHFAANAPGAGPLENPWAIVQAPDDFGAFSHALLIGNVEGAGHINAYNFRTGAYLGQLQSPNGTPLAIAGLWDLTFGGGSPLNGQPDQLFFDAGPNAPNPAGNGLFGLIVASEGAGVVEPTSRGPGQSVDAAVLGLASVDAPTVLATLPPTLAPVPVRAEALAAFPTIQDSIPGPAQVPIRLSGAALPQALDRVFADLDGDTFGNGFRRDQVSA